MPKKSNIKNNINLKRKVGNKGFPKDTFLIVCEGEKTEPYYFESFRLTSLTITVIGTGLNTIDVVKEAMRIKEEKRKLKEPYDQVWCVFDKDYFPAEHFNNAIDLARNENINVAYSNQSFELWYLLHFHYFSTSMYRVQYIEKLNSLLGHEYKKNSKTMYDELIHKQKDALRNASRLLAQYQNLNPAKNDPSTTVHTLVEELNKFL